MRVKQSFYYPLFKPAGMSVDELFRIASEKGFAATELLTRKEDFEEVVALAKKHGLAVASMVGHGTLADGLNNPANHDRIEEEVKASIDAAAKHGIAGLICFSGNRRDGQSEEEAIQTTVAGFRRVAPYAEKKGVNLNMELLNSRVDHPGYQCDHTSWGVEVLKRAGSPRVKLLYDIYHMQIMEGDIIRTIQTNIRYIGHFHTAGNPGRRDLDDAQELNYSAICRAIAGTDYPYYLGHEFKPKGDPVAALKAAFQVCNQG